MDVAELVLIAPTPAWSLTPNDWPLGPERRRIKQENNKKKERPRASQRGFHKEAHEKMSAAYRDG